MSKETLSNSIRGAIDAFFGGFDEEPINKPLDERRIKEVIESTFESLDENTNKKKSKTAIDEIINTVLNQINIGDDTYEKVNQFMEGKCEFDPEKHLLIGLFDDYCVLYDKVNDKVIDSKKVKKGNGNVKEELEDNI
tara:strand:+ start:1964 stop:2374 length:411 start_codon:yes stop_codon:yes gene_type:complete